MTHELRFERVINATRQVVFDSFTEPGPVALPLIGRWQHLWRHRGGLDRSTSYFRDVDSP
jgi:hypothetical protein